jgi:prepilin-type N-terminal cleavage/methylation domain-containing protein
MSRRAARDGGFTLIELLITVVIMGVITLPLGNFVLAYLHNYTQTTNRLGDSHDIQIATAYLSQDVSNTQSVWVQGGATAFPATYCGQGLGTTVLLLKWDSWSPVAVPGGYTGASSTVSAAYVIEAGTLHRVYCGEISSDATVVHNLLSAAPHCYSVAADGTRTSAQCDTATPPAIVSLTLGISSGSTDSAAPEQPVTIDGKRRQS